MESKIYVSINEIAKFYNVHRHTVERTISRMKEQSKEGIINVGRCVRIDRQKFAEFLEEERNDDTKTVQV